MESSRQPKPDNISQNLFDTPHEDATKRAVPQATENAIMPETSSALEPLEPMEAYHAMTEARERESYPDTLALDHMAARRRGRVEAEGHRISEEMTRRAQERLAAEQQRQARLRVEPPASVTLRLDLPHDREYPTTSSEVRVLDVQKFTQVVAPLDGSASAERAIPYAEALARLTAATLVLLYVKTPPLAAPVAAMTSLDDRLEGIDKDEITPRPSAFDPAEYLKRVRSRLTLPSVMQEVIESDSVLDGLQSLTQDAGYMVFVMAPHHHSLMGKMAYGQVVDGVLQHAGCPMLIIPPQVGGISTGTPAQDITPISAATPQRTFRRMLLPLDGSLLAEAALEPMLGMLLATYDNTAIVETAPYEITLLSIAESYEALPSAQAYVSALCEALRATLGLQAVSWSAAAQVGSAPGAIAAAIANGLAPQSFVIGSAAEQPYHLAVMATHGRGGFKRWLYGSVASYVLEHTQAPMLLVHPRDDDE